MIETDQLLGRQIAAGRTLAGMSQAELAEASNISIPTLRRMEASEGQASGLRNNVDAVRRALEAAGVLFVAENGEGPGVRLKKAVTEKRLDQHQREEAAKSYASDWTKYCRKHKSMAFASASGDLILIQYRRLASLEDFNLLTVRVLEVGFEIDGEIIDEAEMQRRVYELLDSKRL